MNAGASETFRSLSHLIDVLADEATTDRHRRLASAMGDALDRLFSLVADED